MSFPSSWDCSRGSQSSAGICCSGCSFCCKRNREGGSCLGGVIFEGGCGGCGGFGGGGGSRGAAVISLLALADLLPPFSSQTSNHPQIDKKANTPQRPITCRHVARLYLECILAFAILHATCLPSCGDSCICWWKPCHEALTAGTSAYIVDTLAGCHHAPLQLLDACFQNPVEAGRNPNLPCLEQTQTFGEQRLHRAQETCLGRKTNYAPQKRL